ncbi:MAG: replication initiator protein [Microvirus sp.]|nr:MAG: replication initiator protein [Microvirus sp.]
MRCVRPLSAWQTDDGTIVFAERGHIRRALTLRCGQCVGCRLERSRQWAVRCMHEASLHLLNSFVTLTYDDEHLAADRSLRYRDFQLFMKRLRKVKGPTRFYMCGEYGSKFDRPHFHACLFGAFFDDRVYFSNSPAGERLYRSRTLEGLWPHGFSSIGDITFESAAYVARYCMKKVTGQLADRHYEYVVPDTGEIVYRVPEFARMSNGGGKSKAGGIGAPWFKKFRADVFPGDYVVVRGVKCRPPRYYGQLLEMLDSDDWAGIVLQRSNMVTSEMLSDSTPERLAVIEAVALSKAKCLSRTLS